MRGRLNIIADISNEDSLINKVVEKKYQRSLSELYRVFYDILSTYIDLPEEDKKVICFWGLAAAFKSAFITFPFLYLNASMGSGKTRLLKLLEVCIPKAVLTPNLTEASLIRLPSQEQLNAILIDEAERMTSKEKSTLRELLNQAYKRGGSILRVEENKEKVRVVKKYPVFTGIALANIWGLEPVLEDRCITLVLQKSKNAEITKIAELYEFDDRIENLRRDLLVYEAYISSQLEGVCESIFLHFLYKRIASLRDNLDQMGVGSVGYVGLAQKKGLLEPTGNNNIHILHYTQPTLPTQPTLNIENLNELLAIPIEKIIQKMQNSDLSGRNMEIWLPLLTIAALIDESIFDDLMEIAIKRSKNKEEGKIMDDIDTIFASFLFYHLSANGTDKLYTPKDLKDAFLEIEGEKEWITTEWIGRCLKRLNIIKAKIRRRKGFEMELDLENVKKYLDSRNIEIDESFLEEYKSKNDKKPSEESQKTVEEALEKQDKGYKDFKDFIDDD
jgi:hypothetical protein